MRDHYLPGLGVPRKWWDLISALSAVLMAQVIIGFYVVSAFMEKTDDVAEEHKQIKAQLKGKEAKKNK